MAKIRTVSLAATLIALVVGGMAGYWVGQNAKDHPPAARVAGERLESARERQETSRGAAPVNETGVRQRDQDLEPAPVPALEPGLGSPRVEPGSPPPGLTTLEERLTWAMEILPPVERLKGEGTISGRVLVAGDLSPIAGVLVEATGELKDRPRQPNPARRDDGQPSPDNYQVSSMMRAIENVRTSKTLHYHTRTAPDGTFSLAGLADATFRVQVRSPDFEFRVVTNGKAGDSVARDVESGADLTFHGTRRFAVGFDVRLPDGSPALFRRLQSYEVPKGVGREAALLNAGAYSFQSRGNWEGPGDFRYLPAGLHAFRTETGGAEAAYASDTVVEEIGDGKPNLVVLQLREVPSLHVTIEDQSGEEQPVDSFEVHVMPWEKSDPPTQAEFQSFRNFKNDAPEFLPRRVYRLNSPAVFPNLEPGRYAIVVMRGHRESAAHAFASVGTGQTQVTVTVLPPPRESYIILWITGPAGEPVTGNVRTQLNARQGVVGHGAGGSPRKLKDGSYRLAYQDVSDSMDPALPVRWRLEVTATAHGTRMVEVERKGQDEVRIQFEAPASLDVEIPGFGGVAESMKLLAWLGMEYLPAYHNSNTSKHSGTATSTGFRFEGVQPGTIGLRLCVERTLFGEFEVLRQPVTLRSGSNTIRLALPTFHSLTVSVPDSPPFAVVTVSKWMSHGNDPDGREVTTRNSATVQTNENRQATFPYLLAGTYTLSCSDTDRNRYEPASVTIPETSSFTLRPKPRE